MSRRVIRTTNLVPKVIAQALQNDSHKAAPFRIRSEREPSMTGEREIWALEFKRTHRRGRRIGSQNGGLEGERRRACHLATGGDSMNGQACFWSGSQSADNAILYLALALALLPVCFCSMGLHIYPDLCLLVEL